MEMQVDSYVFPVDTYLDAYMVVGRQRLRDTFWQGSMTTAPLPPLHAHRSDPFEAKARNVFSILGRAKRQWHLDYQGHREPKDMSD